MLIDTSGLLAALLVDQDHHAGGARAQTAATGPVTIPPFVLAELDHLTGRLAGVDAQPAPPLAGNTLRLLPADG